jgi:hypothetical protein
VIAHPAARVPAGRYLGWAVPGSGIVLAAVIAAGARWGPDWPAQEFRAWTAAHNGVTAWTNQWYSGQALPGYSLIYPVISEHLGAALTGLGAVVAATLGAARLAPDNGRALRAGFHVSVALVLAADLFIGQVPYLVGVAFGVWGLRALRTGHSVGAGVFAAASSLASPLAGAFLLLAVPALCDVLGWRRAAPFGAAGLGLLLSTLIGGASGPFPFIWRVFAWTAIFAVCAVVLPVRAGRSVRILGLTFGLAALVAFAVPNPVGGNLARFGQLLALPLCWHVLPRLRWAGRRARVGAAVLVAAAALWPTWPALTALDRGAADPSRSAGFYAGLRGFLRTQDGTAGRLEVVFTREHWESIWVAKSFPIARGWERQTDLRMNATLYHPLTAAAYRRWLDDNAVSLVALPTVPIDFGGAAEASLLRHPPAYLVPAWHDANWQVWRVRASHPLVTGPATVEHVGVASLVMRFQHAGTATIRIRGNGMWAAARGEACVSHDAGGWLTVAADAAGPLTLRARVGLDALAAGTRCS